MYSPSSLAFKAAVWCNLVFMQVLVEAETEDGLRHSILLQNAETVRLIGPQLAESPEASESHTRESGHTSDSNTVQPAEQSDGGQPQFVAVSVSELEVGQMVYLHLQGAARHTGISIQENIVER